MSLCTLILKYTVFKFNSLFVFIEPIKIVTENKFLSIYKLTVY